MRFAINASVRATALAGAFFLSACASVGGSPDATVGSSGAAGNELRHRRQRWSDRDWRRTGERW